MERDSNIKENAMEMIGHSNYWHYALSNGEFGKGFGEVLEAHEGTFNLFDIALDMFIYGLICGKRIERRRRRARSMTD